MEGSAAAQEAHPGLATASEEPAAGALDPAAEPGVYQDPDAEPEAQPDIAAEPEAQPDIAAEPDAAPAAEAGAAADGGAAPPNEPTAGETGSHLFAIKTTGGQEKVVMNMLEAKTRLGKLGIQSVLLVDNLKGYVVIEASNPNLAYGAIDGVRHIRGQLRGELDFGDIEGYLVKRSSAAQLSVDATVEITGGPFKGMRATVSRIDAEKEEATVVLLDAAYQLPVTVDANYLKPAKPA